jgi:predicted nucleic acid-binding protein
MATSWPERVLLDSNIPMYAAGHDHPYRAPCQELLARALAGRLDAATNVEVHQEILHRYISLGLATRAREVSEDFQAVVPNVLPVTLPDIARSRELSARYPALPARDLIHVAVMLNNGIATIVSADRHFDQVVEIVRLGPDDALRTS